MKKYSFDDHPQHKEQLKLWADKWIKNAMSTEAMTDEDKEKCRDAVEGLYRAANLTPPPRHRIVFVPSPFVLRFAGGFAAAIWWLRNNKDKLKDVGVATEAATWDATRGATWAATKDAIENLTWNTTRTATDAAIRAATRDATEDATEAATRAATRAATWDATEDAIRDATEDATKDAIERATRATTRDATEDAIRAAAEDATRDATEDAIRAATEDATNVATWAATRTATRAATEDAIRAAIEGRETKGKLKWYNFDVSLMTLVSNALKIGTFGLRCAESVYNMWNGGNQWSGYSAFLSFFRHVAKLPLDYEKWDTYEALAKLSGPRIMHKEFCIISDRPKKLLVDNQNRPHNYDGPFCEWRDGTALYSIHGVRVPMWICETKKEDFTKEMILGENNADYRRCIVQKLGIKRTIELLGAETIDKEEMAVGGTYELLMIDYDGTGNKRPYLKMLNPSIKEYHIEGVGPNCKTVQDAIMYRNGLKKFQQPKELS